MSFSENRDHYSGAMKSFFIKVYGCQMNVYDSIRIRDHLTKNDYVESASMENSDIIIFYTCNIREKAVSKLLSDIGRIKNREKKIIAVGGCVAQAEQNEFFNKCEDISIVFGPQTYHNLHTYIEEVFVDKSKKILDIKFTQAEKFVYLPSKKIVSFSEFVSIQEGCDNFCTYCVVPYTRGREYSRPATDIVNEVRELVENGAKEITLLGQNVNSYKSEYSFEKLLRSVANINGVRRLRYTTSHPKDFTEELMNVHQELKEIMPPFAHIPVQSGSDRILKLMNRGHTAEDYIKKTERFREICNEISFSSDFIVGFPGESEKDFYDTINLVKKVNFSLFYAFKYSRRKNTPAYNMKNQIPMIEKNKRFEILHQNLMEQQLKFNKSCIDTSQTILIEKLGKKEKQYIGRSPYMQSVVIESDHNVIGEFLRVDIKNAFQNSLFGDLRQ
ncbi:MAG: tRNA (N6-isopentenyl adenosine(37)-C2)-methylthiotransferase MiaB [Holosporales bacterium]|jgi:tRNA-2-methylthio-N6-dimethylallyladenosine synthase|nr:tRNA (N6-isopentenyl adenosine(37)-C2)-methylthiotransferase MiaB [Holosporales bacterium]